MNQFDDGLGKGKPGKAPAPMDAGIPVGRNGANTFGNDGAAYQYPEAEINYDQLDGAPVDGTPLYPDAVMHNPKLSRFRIHGCKDLWAAVLFGILVLFSIIWSIVQLATYTYEPGKGVSPAFDNGSSVRVAWVAGVCAVAVGGSLVTSFALLVVAQRMPVQMIYIANILTILMFIISAIMAFVRIDIVVGILMLVCAAFQALWLFLVRDRIPLAATLLCTAAKLISKYKSNFVLNIGLCVVMFGYIVLWGFGVAAPIDRLNRRKGNGGHGFAIGLLVFVLLWVCQVVPNVMHVTASGLIATWYYAGSNNMPPHPTIASFKRATTTSFGSICFGSLIVAIIQFLRWLLESSRDNENGFVRCCVDCMLRCIENIVQYFNRYAFVHVAIYGCGYIEGAKRTFELCQQCFFAAYFNDCLVVPTLNMFTFAIAILFGIIAGVASSSWPVGVLVFFMSALVHQLVFTGVDSAVTTIFVCFAENPEALRESDPELYAAIHAADANGTNNNASPPV
ncbi:putative mitochondrial hypothetical protein [Leptomonas pyrrhocoris]|uniref:Choline transporter-like protein n=1 Tax=Leptomonas pyrrhocoris TaxID=157538 RepID=A0A0N0DVJ6_LEPPY|nr:putative mitochondrial hypothetical protein [Leptomonas pyrrhocoris]XP_015658620.1 putative mitochondrial hypothetical protein [Leptomonas pyrrhocoris]KPA80180.1 putative mitochondrial hypothetical protein [Leptomonas pyrrhocoris]KPA80181.1 putative mitochondrial hypothetical protein [Leptomonas pyrrhocoris]|eukprot:XP_015658619.1 putative mitochondrial hypothetical protein [Leptomonas pyrrhocoris]